MTTNESRRLAQRYWRAKVAGRRIWVEAKRCGYHPSTLYKHAHLWPEVLEELKACSFLRPWEREVARTLEIRRLVI